MSTVYGSFFKALFNSADESLFLVLRLLFSDFEVECLPFLVCIYISSCGH